MRIATIKMNVCGAAEKYPKASLGDEWHPMSACMHAHQGGRLPKSTVHERECLMRKSLIPLVQ